jgi:hypothetical protein
MLATMKEIILYKITIELILSFFFFNLSKQKEFPLKKFSSNAIFAIKIKRRLIPFYQLNFKKVVDFIYLIFLLEKHYLNFNKHFCVRFAFEFDVDLRSFDYILSKKLNKTKAIVN